MKHLYIVESNGNYKIGVTSNSLEKRVASMQTGNPNFINKILLYKNVCNAYAIEKQLHNKLQQYNITGEWFSCNLQTILNILNILLPDHKDIKDYRIKKINYKYKKYKKNEKECIDNIPDNIPDNTIYPRTSYEIFCINPHCRVQILRERCIKWLENIVEILKSSKNNKLINIYQLLINLKPEQILIYSEKWNMDFNKIYINTGEVRIPKKNDYYELVGIVFKCERDNEIDIGCKIVLPLNELYMILQRENINIKMCA